MAENEIFDICIIGGGPGGYVAAIHAAHLGAKVALIEKDKLGGTCLNRGCIPTKALVRSAEVMMDIKRSSDFGIDIENYRLNFQKVMARKAAVVEKLVGGVEQLMKANKVTVYRGIAHMISPYKIKVNDDEITAKKTVIATGSESTLLPIPGWDLPGMLTTDTILELKDFPKSLIVIGGSYTGSEFACIFAAFGTKVTIVKRRPLRLEPADEEIGRRFAQTLPRLGINVIIGAAVKAVRESPEGLRVVWDTPEGEKWVDGQKVLVATGRKPYTKELGAAEIGIRMEGPALVANERMETNIKDIYAIGDVLGKHMLAHVASYEGEVAVENALGRSRTADYHAIPSCTFVTPEVACVGITEAEAKEKGIPYKVSKFPFMANGKAVAMDEAVGMIKMVAHAETGKLLGAHLMGPHASDLIAECALAVQTGITVKEIAHTIHAHPTLPEAVMETAMAQLDGAIHFQKM